MYQETPHEALQRQRREAAKADGLFIGGIAVVVALAVIGLIVTNLAR